MSEYILQRHLSGNDYGEWGRSQQFEASNDEAAKREAMDIIGDFERLHYGNTPIRILKITFEGPPSDTGFPYPINERIERLEVEKVVNEVASFLKIKGAALDYHDLNFMLQTVPEGLTGAGYSLRLLYGSGYGFMGSVTDEEVDHAGHNANLRPGDTTISAYYINGPDGAMCVSVSKIVSFQANGRTPKELIHLWPLEFDNLAIDSEKLRKAKIEDGRDR